MTSISSSSRPSIFQVVLGVFCAVTILFPYSVGWAQETKPAPNIATDCAWFKGFESLVISMTCAANTGAGILKPGVFPFTIRCKDGKLTVSSSNTEFSEDAGMQCKIIDPDRNGGYTMSCCTPRDKDGDQCCYWFPVRQGKPDTENGNFKPGQYRCYSGTSNAPTGVCPITFKSLVSLPAPDLQDGTASSATTSSSGTTEFDSMPLQDLSNLYDSLCADPADCR